MRGATLAAWGLAGLLATTSLSARADGAISEEARRHFKAGVAHLQDPEGERVEDAYREFREAYSISKSPKILGNMGICAMKLERDGEAIEAYSSYLRDAPDIDAAEREQIVRDLQTLTVGVVRATFTIAPAGAQVVDVRVPNRGERITNVYTAADNRLDIGIRPGHHAVTVKAPGYDPQTWEFEAHAGGRTEHAFTLQKTSLLPPPGAAGKSGPSVAPWIVAGAGGALVIGGAITGLVALGKTKDLERACPNDTCPRSFDLDSPKSSARTFALASDVLFISGGALVVTGIVWGLVANRGGSKESTPVVAAACNGAGCSGTLRLRF